MFQNDTPKNGQNSKFYYNIKIHFIKNRKGVKEAIPDIFNGFAFFF